MQHPVVRLFASEKTLAQAPKWRADGRSFVLAAPVDLEGVTLEGLELRGRATCGLPDRDVTLQLQYHLARGPKLALERIDWRPLKPHNNKGKGPPEYRNRLLRGSHVHSFALNWLPDEGWMRTRPLAEPLPWEPGSFADFVAIAEARFRILSLRGLLPPPPWELDLFDA